VTSPASKTNLFAELLINRADHMSRDARPSDSIAIALASSAHLRRRHVAGWHGDCMTARRSRRSIGSLKSYLQNLDPEDFGRFTP